MSEINLEKLKLSICGRDLLSRVKDEFKPTHFISIISGRMRTKWDPNHSPPDWYKSFPGKKICLNFDDVTTSISPEIEISYGYISPKEKHVERIIQFAKELGADLLAEKECRLLVHCAAGISRSTAAAYIVLCTILEPEQEPKAVEMVQEARPQAIPNSLMIQLANNLLRDSGRQLASFPQKRGLYAK